MTELKPFLLEYKAFGCVGVAIVDHKNTVAYSHRGDIFKDFRSYCTDIIFADSSPDGVFIPNRWQSAGDTRMESHLFYSMLTTHESYDCWLLFLDDRCTNGRDN
eukprot:159764_1